MKRGHLSVSDSLHENIDLVFDHCSLLTEDSLST